MSSMQKDPRLKILVREGYRAALTLHALLATRTAPSGAAPRVYFGGARAGNVGGPLVKVKRLQEYFPEHRWRYNLLYLLSNAPYLSERALDWMRRKRVPIVLNQNGVFYPGWYEGDWEAQNRIMARAYHRADHVFWQSDFCRRSADRFLGPRTGKGEILYNAIDVKHFSPSPGHAPRPFTFLITGKLGKHLEYRIESTIQGLAHACKAGLDARLAIAGWVEDPRSVRAMADRFGVAARLSLLGTYSQEAAPDVYRGADVYVMTKYLDPCPNTVLEAMACGLPILYSDSGGVPELVGPDAGLALPVPEDWETIHVPAAADIGEGMLKLAAARAPMAAAARERAVRCFDISNWIERHRGVFDDLMRSR